MYVCVAPRQVNLNLEKDWDHRVAAMERFETVVVEAAQQHPKALPPLLRSLRDVLTLQLQDRRCVRCFPTLPLFASPHPPLTSGCKTSRATVAPPHFFLSECLLGGQDSPGAQNTSLCIQASTTRNCGAGLRHPSGKESAVATVSKVLNEEAG